eukprot:TRINITY_DN65739_c6_g7_i1.p1 TRINITY_DN65739_c6_g7~~TRINITY_DN65739_c6_g7_i1.p1  ORF type:complete len:793 (+),score=495.80 TRINITY_DN65739_c6_g7_i1:138-2516(+)
MNKDLSNLVNLRNLIKRDPGAYHAEFKQQKAHFESSLEIMALRQDGQEHHNHRESKAFAEQVSFMAHVAGCYPEDGASVPSQLLELIDTHYDSLTPYVRRTIVQSLILLCNRDLIDRLVMLPVFFRLFRCQDKELRKMLFSHIVNDIKRLNESSRNEKLNRSLQNFIFNMLSDENTKAARKALSVMMELWRKRVWRDAQLVNAIGKCCFDKDAGKLTAALRFFLGLDDDDEDLQEEVTGRDYKMLSVQAGMMRVTKRRKKRTRELKRQLKQLKKKEKAWDQAEAQETTADDKDKKAHSSVVLSFSALDLLYDPQQMADRLFSQLRRTNHAFQVRLLMMNVISRLIGRHKLFVENFYPFLQKYMQPHQRYVTQVVTFLAQASHDLVPPDWLQPCVLTLANNFVTDRSRPEIMAVGINAIREVAARCPLVMNEELLQDLAEYKKSKQKGVMMASRSIISLFREVAPHLLARKDRGKDASVAMLSGEQQELQYGVPNVATDVDGGEMLHDALEANGIDPEDLDKKDEAWERETRIDLLKADSDEDDDDVDERVLMKFLHEDDDEDEDEDDGEAKKQPKADEEDQDQDQDEDDDGDDDNDNDDDDDGSERSKRRRLPGGASTNDNEEKSKKQKKKELPLAARRILTPHDFELIRLEKLKRKAMLMKGNTRARAAAAAAVAAAASSRGTAAVETSDEVDMDSIIGWQKKEKANYAERWQSVLEGREGRDKFGRPKEKQGGTTNAVKESKKPFMLVKHKRSIRAKKREKFVLRQARMARHIQNLKQMAKSNHKKRKRG